MSFKSITATFLVLSAASILGVAALLLNIRVPPLALFCLMFLNSAAFGAMILTYKEVQTRTRMEALVGILAFTTLANALEDFYGWTALAVCVLPVVLAMLFRYAVRRY